MPLFSDHISNMYYSGSSPYTSLPYSYSSAVPPYGSSYSASYLNPGGNYSSHSSFGGYSRAPLGSRWLTSGGRAYSPILSSISEKGTSSPVRINSPRRIPISSRTYVSSPYSSRPININTADIDVSRDKYRNKISSSSSSTTTGLPPRRESPLINKENGHDKPDTGIDTSPGPKRSTIKRDRTVVRLHTVKRKERDSPRKPVEDLNKLVNKDTPKTEFVENQIESKKWREKLADDLAYKAQKEKKTLGAKLVEKFTLKEKNDDEYDYSSKKSPVNHIDKEKSPVKQNSDDTMNLINNKSFDRRCSMELLAEQASLLDSLIRRENLSTAPLDISKVGSKDIVNTDIKLDTEHTGITQLDHQQNRLSTTKSDHSLHDRLSSKDIKEPLCSKRRSLRKCSSGSNIRKLDCIKEIPKKTTTFNVPPFKVNSADKDKKSKPKIKTKITSTVEVTPATTPLKFIVENVTVEEKIRPGKKDIIFSSILEETQTLSDRSTENDIPKTTTEIKNQLKPQVEIEVDTSCTEVSTETEKISTLIGHRKSIKSKIKDISKQQSETCVNISSPEPDDGNFWEKLGKRETVYLMKRKQNLEEAREKSKRSLFWFPEEEALNIDEDSEKNIAAKSSEETTEKNSVDAINETTKKIEPLRDEHKNKSVLQQKANANNAVDNISLLNAQEQDKKSIIKIRENTSDGKNVTNVQETPSIIELDKDSKKEKEIYDTLKVVNQDQEIKLREFNTKSKNSLNNSERLAEDSKNINKTKDNNKDNIGENEKEIHNKLKDVHQDQEIKLVESNAKSKITLDKNDELAEDTISINTSKDIKKDNIGEKEKKNCNESKDEQETKLMESNSKSKIISSKNDKLAKDSTSTNKSKDKKKDNIGEKENKDNISEKEKKNQDPKIKLTESNTKSKLMLNKNDKLTEDPNYTNKSKDNKKDNVGERDFYEKNLFKSNLNDLQNSNYEKELNVTSSNINLNLIEDKTNKCKRISPDTINNTKEEAINTLTVSIKNKNNNTMLIGAVDTLENSNIPDTIVFEKSPKGTNKDNKTSEFHEIKPEKQDRIQKNSNSQNEEIPSNNNDKSETTTSTTTTNENIGLSNVNDSDKKLSIKEPNDKHESDTETEKTKTSIEIVNETVSSTDAIKVFTPVKPVKEEKALKTLIATPRPLQKRNPQSIRSSSSSSESSDDDSSDEDAKDEDKGEDEFSQGEGENNTDGRISTGSNDSGFDSSAPTSPSGFLQTKKGGDSPSTSAGITPPQTFTHDILEQELEHSTAYDLFRKTGRFTPPARSIPRFRKYTIEDFQFIRVLGKGSFGKVMLAELRDTEYYYAVKCLKKDVVLEDDDVECTLIERKVLALGTNHPYLCHLFATFQTDSHLFFVMEYLNGGDLMFHIQQSGRFPEVKARFYAAEIVSGLKFLHKRGIVYRDLKLDNILLDFDGHVRIADFGMCKLQIYLDKTADTFCGTPDYMAPEIIRGLKYNQTVDWWSFGVLLYEMLIGQSPFSGCDEDELFWSICNEMPAYPRFLSSESLSILTRLLDKDARTRLGGPECMHGDIRDQKFFEQIHWDRLERRELEAPFKPRVRHPMDTQYFDRAFTGERPRLTAVEPQVLRSMDQEPFRGFSYTNPNATDR
ncbi:dual specificity protein kinase splB isoform X2 [Bicyclus anynana]|uniref:Dual specificity protein kinase splB isoform X2 n=1 Tax=Bicyclus anynana TaxID=110368 RepID=A0ABM3LHB2_BICAN|nr:dual specificity protein kinase splB isoform X2 [Bicyclus anynana]